MLTEPGVALTDYLLALECALFVWLLCKPTTFNRAIRNNFVLFFASVSVAALLGGTVHGFFSGEASFWAELLWRLTLIAIGVAAFSMWSVWALLLFSPKAAKVIRCGAAVEMLVFSVFAIVANQSFWVAIADYVPAVLMLLTSFLVLYMRNRNTSFLAGGLGLMLAIFASFLQQRRIGLHPVYFNHNALYHVLQAVALLMVFCTAQYSSTLSSSAKG